MNGKKVLLVEDDQLTQSLLKSYLEKESFVVSTACDAKEMSRFLKAQQFALLLLDLGLPDEDGLVLIRQIRMVSDIPIVVITSRADQTDRISALEMGADDYLTKPFDPMELVLRVQNIIKRADREGRTVKTKNERLPVGKGWILRLDSHCLLDDTGHTVSLTRAEYDILVALARAPNRVLSRDQLLDATAHFGNEPSERTIDVLIGRLRRKLGTAENNESPIKTISGSGYMLSIS